MGVSENGKHCTNDVAEELLVFSWGDLRDPMVLTARRWGPTQLGKPSTKIFWRLQYLHRRHFCHGKHHEEHAETDGQKHPDGTSCASIV
jgi:hypothetical protein